MEILQEIPLNTDFVINNERQDWKIGIVCVCVCVCTCCRGKVNGRDEGEGIWLMGFIYIYIYIYMKYNDEISCNYFKWGREWVAGVGGNGGG
jgi:hypothetical protein